MPNENNKKLSFPTTLIIGLGGVGSRITAGVYKQFMDRLPNRDDQDNVVCLCFDTDANDIKKYKTEMGLREEWAVQTSSTQSFTVGQYINRIKDSTTVLDWFDTTSPEVIKMKLNDGAGQIRMASRLAYMSAIADGKLQAIDNSLRKLLMVDPERHQGNEIKVHIVCSLAGGTGAGSFLQTAYYVKDVMRSLNIDAPRVLGYFVLGDVLCHDTDAALSEPKKENVRANTYACMKELTAFINREESQLIKKLEFEYKAGQEDIGLPTCDPYDLCYMIDYTNVDGTNIGDMQIYYNQVKDFLYMNAFSPYGDTQRSRLINDTIQHVQTNGNARYAALGISKMVFPVNDLYEYFATQRLVDNLSATWVNIDNAFKDEYENYTKSIREGIPKPEPEIGEYFLTNVEHKAKNGSGMEKVEFKSIYDSIREIGDDGVAGVENSVKYAEAVEEYIETVLSSSKALMNHKETCEKFKGFGEDSDYDSESSDIDKHEGDLKNFRDYVFQFIESSRRGIVKECFLADASQAGRVSKDYAKHHLNSYILVKGKELHPIAVRCFLYEVRDYIKDRLEGEKGLIKENEELEKTITEGYEKKYDSHDDKLEPDHVETAVERLQIAYKQKSLFNKGSVDEIKDKYITESKKQMNNIWKFAINKLTQYVWEGLQVEILQLIEESENFFNRLPDTIRMLTNKCNDLLVKHDGKADPTVMYVLATKKIKEYLYGEIKRGDQLLIPTDISARIYRSMFDNTRIALDRTTSLGALSDDEEAEEARERVLVEANNRLFEGVVQSQIRTLRASFPEYAEMNIIQALRKEGELMKATEEEAYQYMKKKFDAVRDMAIIRGAYNLNTSVTYINSWGINNLKGATEEEVDDLFGSTDVRTNPQTAADHEPNAFYSQYELVRANSVSLLELENNFKGFSKKKTDSNEDGFVGSYRKAYDDVNERLVDNQDDISRHLDQRWQLPSYMPNIGEDLKDTLKDIFSALYYGLLFEKFNTREKDGEEYWCYNSNFIYTFTGWPIPLCGSQNLGSSLNDLFEKGLVDNPDIVNEINEEAGRQWKAAYTTWQNTDRASGDMLALMKEQPIIKKMVREMDYGVIYNKWVGKNWKWFSFLSGNSRTTLANIIEELRDFFFEDLINRVIGVFGPSANTRELCKYLFEAIPEEAMKKAAMTKVDTFDRNHKFVFSAK